MSLIEVERKFQRLAVKDLMLDGGIPPFRSLKYCGKQKIHDIYYDKADMLSSCGLWVRQRNNHWEAKIKRGGNYINSKFEELSSPVSIARRLEELTGIRASGHQNFGLQPMASFTTLRESWQADEKFTIVQDVMDFGHTVGEVELQCRLDSSGSGSEACRDAKMAQMDAEIVAFMKRYLWAFILGVPKGKLTAYFERTRSK
ncbi:thiamine-triphosphatase [Aspergillus melleus]|uniref:thiamine-triphosphatase n=1 Tax=Aspergillus melleus TaxID=138277 RepID=UPI001E8CA5DA|nr:uncharacterized protein LDX57_007817 [Aspergillus melleus]KAH8430147.1 hypothetical protein LDX57_007817 [Aspergillus melleus]